MNDVASSWLAPFIPYSGALVLATIIVFLLRIPQASRTVSESYDRLVAQLHADNDKLRLDVEAVRKLFVQERLAREEGEEECRQQLAANREERMQLLEELNHQLAQARRRIADLERQVAGIAT